MKLRRTRLALAAVLVVEAVLLLSGPATAGPSTSTHTGNGNLVVEARHPVSPTTVHYVVRLTWSGDGHPAEQSYVTATVVGLGGEAAEPVALYSYDTDGRYAGTVTFPGPGVWTVRFSSASPPVSIDHPEVLADGLTDGLTKDLLAGLLQPKPA